MLQRIGHLTVAESTLAIVRIEAQRRGTYIGSTNRSQAAIDEIARDEASLNALQDVWPEDRRAFDIDLRHRPLLGRSQHFQSVWADQHRVTDARGTD